nr:MAG TPA: hypothetical protein [Caudoviricetes sp.]
MSHITKTDNSKFNHWQLSFPSISIYLNIYVNVLVFFSPLLHISSYKVNLNA